MITFDPNIPAADIRHAAQAFGWVIRPDGHGGGVIAPMQAQPPADAKPSPCVVPLRTLCFAGTYAAVTNIAAARARLRPAPHRGHDGDDAA